MGPRVSQHNAPNRVTTSKTLPSCRSYESRLSPRRQLPIQGREEDGVALGEASRKVNDTRRCHQRRSGHNRTRFSSVALHSSTSPRSRPVPIRCLTPPSPQQLAIEAPLTAEGTRLKPSPSTSTRNRSNHRVVHNQIRHSGLHPRQGTATRMDQNPHLRPHSGTHTAKASPHASHGSSRTPAARQVPSWPGLAAPPPPWLRSHRRHRQSRCTTSILHPAAPRARLRGQPPHTLP